MSEKDQILAHFNRESAITQRVLQAFPNDKLDFKPHEKSRSAKALGLIFVAENEILKDIIDGKPVTNDERETEVTNMAEIVSRYQASVMEVKDKFHNIPERQFTESVNFFGQDMKRIDALWIMLLDQVHHRGQMSVYIRLAGGMVPAIYGPSADDAGAI